MPTTTTVTVPTAAGPVPVTLAEQGSGRPVLLLHGGAGPQSVAGFAELLAGTRPARVLTPTHPGFSGTPRPVGLDSIADLAALYVALLGELDLTGITVVGNSIGGWTAAEMALLADPRVGGVVLVDAVGLASDTDPVVDFFSLTMDQVTDLSYADPDRFRLDVDTLPAAAREAMAGNRAALLAYGGTTMADPTLLDRLPAVDRPVLVVWGAADRVVGPSHGEAYARAIPGARLEVIGDAGHLPQLETPDRLAGLVWSVVEGS
ncbi:Pimeloyl-ACP methyl ester carboxylesterase [Klenkia soli]|uniref:Pimeloyl-ACP methyl ester carboxylesterase n=1 Tax=Klenkia soli TaxID=1052260 RepID=A0A1H0SJX9_9ACTN|nr:alpha/beta hydrolase [Klenkia soli]SDP42081.1 Pimeloyl-ACP methyl ester carboxylesterase [Klenkia soli]